MSHHLQSIEDKIKPLSQRQRFSYLSDVLLAHDKDTFKHSKDVANMANAISRKIGYSAAEQKSLYYTAYFHDFGKLGIDESLLNKKGPLSLGDWGIIQQHPEMGHYLVEKYLSDYPINGKAILYHHENVNGTGYPYGLSGDELDDDAKILRIIDSLVAMVEKRCYQESISCCDAVNDLLLYENTHYDSSWLQAIIGYVQNDEDLKSLLHPQCKHPEISVNSYGLK